jgi:hypothetical protein
MNIDEKQKELKNFSVKIFLITFKNLNYIISLYSITYNSLY